MFQINVKHLFTFRSLGEKGSSLLQVILIGSVLAGLGVYLMQTTQQQNKIVKSVEAKGAYGVLKKEISEALASSQTCQMTLQQYFDSPIETDMKKMDVPGIKTMHNSVLSEMYMPDQEMFNLKIKQMKLIMPDDYVADDTMRMQTADLAVFIEPARKVSDANASYGGRDIAVKIPLFLFMLNKKIMMCLSLDAQTVIDALMESCTRLGGTYNAVSGVCENLHGTNGKVLGEVRDYLCSASGDSTKCATHPYAGLDCRDHKSPTPVVADKNNWVLRGIRPDGTPNCACIPVKECENPANHCKGIDLGTDWCFNDCGEGTKEDGVCAPCDATAWSPDPATRCEGVSFTQTNGCGETQPSIGTMPDNWSPKATEVCEGETFTQYSSCGAPPKYNVAGTKDCSCPAFPRPHTWSETIAGKTYDCKEDGGSGSTILKHKEKITLSTNASDENQGTADLECNDGVLTKTEKCSSLPKELICRIQYKLYLDKPRESSWASNGIWARVDNGDSDRDCKSNSGCGIRVAVACKGDSEVNVQYMFKQAGKTTPKQETGWSGSNDVFKIGPWSRFIINDKFECEGGGCGVWMNVDVKDPAAKCTVTYQYHNEHFTTPPASNGTWSQMIKDVGDDNCEKNNGCGIKATISCTY